MLRRNHQSMIFRTTSTPATNLASGGSSSTMICLQRSCCWAKSWAWIGRTGRPSRCYRSVVKRRLFTLALFLLLGAILNVAVGCSSIPRASEPIPVAQYLSERTIGESDDATLVKIAPIAIRLEERIGRICIDIVVEGPPMPALDVANSLVDLVRRSPEDSLEIVKPNGKRLRVVPSPGEPPRHPIGPRHFSVPLGESMARVLAQACADTPLLEQVPAGIYRVRILNGVKDAVYHGRTPYMIDTEWHDFEIFRRTILPAPYEQMPRAYVPTWFRADQE